MYFRGTNRRILGSSNFQQRISVTSGAPSRVDARDKLISSRRPVTDARNVIRQHVVNKVGDLRSVLPRNRGIVKRGRPFRDLRSGIGRFRNMNFGTETRPELVYEEERVAPQLRYKGPQHTNVTIGRGGKVTISRKRGNSIDREKETVQPTGIPAHMRRQPSPPPARPARSPSPPIKQPRRRTPSPSPLRHRRSFSPAQRRPQSYITSSRGSRGAAHINNSPYEEWGESPSAIFDYRHRSRSPIQRTERLSDSPAYSGNMRGYRMQSTERQGRISPSRRYAREPSPVHRRRAPSPEGWSLPSTPPDFRESRRLGGNMRHHSRSLERHAPMELRDSYTQAATQLAQQSSLRMDRVPPRAEKPTYSTYQQRAAPGPPGRGGRVSDMRGNRAVSPAPLQMHYTIKVTSLSKDVSEDDVVELFSDIGPLVSAKLITKGHAEVSFVHKKDAKTAIDKYDRRELDGIPMNLKLIEKSTSGRIK